MPLRIGGLRVKQTFHLPKGDCRCGACVQRLAQYYKSHKISILGAMRCTRCNHVLTHPYWIEQGGSSSNLSMAHIIAKAKSQIPLGYLCCDCEPILRDELNKLSRGPSYHIEAGKRGAFARKTRRRHPIVMNVCRICDGICGAEYMCTACMAELR